LRYVFGTARLVVDTRNATAGLSKELRDRVVKA
jgi:hypothetical protein